jgi:formamidopyrimidine-DNA glycosylase
VPALPELEIVRRDLDKEIVGRRIRDVEVRPGSNAMKIIKRHGRRKEFQELLEGARVDRVERIGRKLVIELDNERALMLDLGTSGQIQKTSASDALAPHTHVVFRFTIGGQLRISDPKLSSELFVIDRDELAGLRGERDSLIDPLATPLAWQAFSSLLERRRGKMKELLCDEDFICGLGDMYSDEVLFSAGIRHDRSSDQLSSQDVRRLYRALTETLQEAVKAGGTSRRDAEFADLQGNPGQFQADLKVYERAGDACRRCRHAIVKESFNGRYTYFCPQCQS